MKNYVVAFSYLLAGPVSPEQIQHVTLSLASFFLTPSNPAGSCWQWLISVCQNHLWCYQQNISHTFTIHRHIHRVLWQGQWGWLLPDSSRSQREPSYFYLCIFSNHGILFLQILFYHTRLFCKAAPACLNMLLHLLPTISTAPSWPSGLKSFTFFI